MGVLACDRLGCENIMCDRLSDDHGYICNECFDELSISPETDIGAFMGVRKPKQTNPEAWAEFVGNVFPYRSHRS